MSYCRTSDTSDVYVGFCGDSYTIMVAYSRKRTGVRLPKNFDFRSIDKYFEDIPSKFAGETLTASTVDGAVELLKLLAEDPNLKIPKNIYSKLLKDADPELRIPKFLVEK